MPRTIIKYLLTFYIAVIAYFSAYSNPLLIKHPDDTLLIKKGFQIKYSGIRIRPGSDSVVIIPDTVEYRITETRGNRADSFYDSLRVKAYKSKLTRELYNLAFAAPPKSGLPENVQIESSERPFLTYSGMIIRKIEFQKLDVFGPTVFDTTRKAPSWLGRKANDAHIKTRTSVIRNNLLFSKGDTVNPVIFADNERLLRGLPYIDNARIVIYEVSGDSVDVRVITKDLFPYGAAGNIYSTKKADIRLWDQNFLGLGQRLDNTITVLPDRNPPLRFDRALYSIENIGGNFVDGTVFYDRDEIREDHGIRFDRNFIPYKIRYPGSAGMMWSNWEQEFRINDSTVINQKISRKVEEIFIGRAYRVLKSSGPGKAEPFMILAGKLINFIYPERPYVSADSNKQFQSYIRLLGRISLSKNNYYSSNYIYNYGRTEDIPHGFLAELTAGYDFGEFYDWTYTGISFSAGEFFRRFGYLYAKFEIGGFFRNSTFTDGTVSFDASYFSRLRKISRIRFRNFINLNYTLGIRRSSTEQISLREGYGLKGISNDLLHGQQRLYINLESIAFLPYYLYGFRIALFSFADFGMIGPYNKPVFSNKLYTALGLGVRIKNENLVFSALEIRLIYYPSGVPSGNELRFELSDEKRIGFTNFLVAAPHVAGFR